MSDVNWQQFLDQLKPKHVTNDSRAVRPGSVFVAYCGDSVDGRDYIDVAIERGAVGILYDPHEFQSPSLNVSRCAVPKLRAQQGMIASYFYKNPSEKMTVIGITGTNGKTSISHFLAQSLTFLGYKTAVVGTLGVGPLSQLSMTGLTTPDPIALQQQLAQFVDEGVQTVVMEVSSHALVQHRVSGVAFDIAVFTQLSRDHLDYHGTLEKYGQAKMRLFRWPTLREAVINWDDVWGQKIIAEQASRISCWATSLDSNADLPEPSLQVKSIVAQSQGFRVNIATPEGEGEFITPLLGRFNISNVLAVLGVLLSLKIPLKRALDAISEIAPVAGRMQRLGDGQHVPVCVVDYAHTPDALSQTLAALREHCQGKLWCVFGCGGNRDTGKRPLMGEIAERIADEIVITDDNPRHESSQEIIDDILVGLRHPQSVHVNADRAAAIAYAVQSATVHDIVLVAGKGHEDYQIIGDKKVAFSDIQQISRQLDLRHKEAI